MSLTPKQEAFCLSYIETGNASEAYRLNYDAEDSKPETIHREAKALLDNPKITTRLDELSSRLVEKAEVTVETIAQQLDEDRLLAHEKGQVGAAVAASMGKARLYGLDKQKLELSAPEDRLDDLE